MLPIVNGEFRAVTDPTLRFTTSGMPVAEFRVAANSRKLNKETNQWEDDKVCWLTIVTFKKLAENVAESVTKGALVNVTGRLQTEDYETKEGEKRQAYKVMADTVGVSIAFVPARPVAAARTEGAPAGDSGDPWATPAPAAPAADPSEPPF